MGSDLYMEQQNYRPKPNKIEWVDDETISVLTDSFYWGYREVYRGPVTPEIQILLKGLGVKVPDKDPEVLYHDQRHVIKVLGPQSKMDEIIVDIVQQQIDEGLVELAKRIRKEFPYLKVEVA